MSLRRYRQEFIYATPIDQLSMLPWSYNPHLCTQRALSLVKHTCTNPAGILHFEGQSDTKLSNIATIPHSSGGTNTLSASHTIALSTIGLLVGILVVYMVACRLPQAKLPPGLPSLPLLGNRHQAPKGAPWAIFTERIEQYGNIVSVNLGGTIIIVGDYETAKDLLDKRRNVYSSRPRLVGNFHDLSRQTTYSFVQVLERELVCNSSPIMFKPFGEFFFSASETPSASVEPSGSGLLHI
jgi:hypothetical protein